MSTETRKKKSVWKVVIQLLVVVLIFIGLLFAVNELGDFNDLADKLKNMDTTYLLIVIGLTLTYLIFMIMPHFLIAVFHKTKLDKTRLFLNASNEYFFNGITPAQSGSQPFQSYIYLKHGVTADETSSILTTTYINYQVVANILSSIALVILALFHGNILQGRLAIVIIGFSLNFAVLLLIIFLTISRKFPSVIQKFFYLLAKIKPLRNKMTKLGDDTPKTVRKFQKSTQEMLLKKRFLILTTIVRVIALLAFYSIPFFVARALRIDVSNQDFLFMMSISLVATTLMAWFPLPGSSGGVETVFVVLLTAVATINRTSAVSIMFITRLFTFYLAMIWGLIALGLLKLMDRKKERNAKHYRQQIAANEDGSLRVGIVCDSFHDNPEAINIYNELKNNNHLPYIITHTKHDENPDNTIYLKISKLRIIRYFKNNNVLFLSPNYRRIRKHNFDILHFVNAISHSRLLLNLKKHEALPIFLTDTVTCSEMASYNKFQKDNICYRLEKMLIASDRVLPKTIKNANNLQQQDFKPSYVIAPIFFSSDEFQALKTNEVIKLDETEFKNRYLLVFANFELERYVDFYFGIKDNEELLKDSQFIILGNLKLTKGLKKSLVKNGLENNFIIIDDFANASKYLSNVSAYIKEEYSALTAIFYLASLANHVNVLLPNEVQLPEGFMEMENIYFYSYQQNFADKLSQASNTEHADINVLNEYFKKPVGMRLATLYSEIAHKKWKENTKL